jgi:hypothetical protein
MTLKIHPLFAAIMTSSMALASCSRNEDPSPLAGEWGTGMQVTSWGEAETVLVFDRGILTMHFTSRSGESIRESSPYVIENETIISEGFNDGKPMPYTLKDGVLELIDPVSGVMRLTKR